MSSKTISPSTPVWFIAGASSGWGLEVAREALSRGHAVLAAARTAARLQPLADLGATVITLDVTGPETDIAAAVAAAHAVYGRFTHVVNSAGYILSGAVEESSADEVAAMYATNVLGTHKVCRAVLPYLRADAAAASASSSSSSSPDQALPRPSITNIGSIGSWIGAPSCAHYAATKWAVTGLTEGLRAEVAPFGIDVLCVELGYFRTSFLTGGALTRAADVLDAYATGPVADGLASLAAYNGKQPGDPVRGARVYVDVLERKLRRGESTDALPLRLVLGSDALAVVRGKCEETLALLREWEDVSASTDFQE